MYFNTLYFYYGPKFMGMRYQLNGFVTLRNKV